MTSRNGDPHGGYIYACNLDDTRTPAGIKVRWKVRVATGAEAKRLDTIQAQAIMALLAWADRHPDAYQPPSATQPE